MSGASDKLYELIGPAVTGLGYELVGIEWLPAGRGGILRVYIDQEAGITVDDCSRVSHQVSGVLDVEDPIPGHYNLEISSPGLDRPLFKDEDYERFKGAKVKVKSHAPVEGRKRFKGVLLGLEAGAVVLEVEGERVVLPLDNVREARLEPEF